MIKLSIAQPDCLQVAVVQGEAPFFGCDQQWYGTEWQRRAGCGPTVAATLFYYLFRPGKRCFSQAEWLDRMEEI